MRAVILFTGAALAVTACGKTETVETNAAAEANLTANAIVANDTTAIDAATNDAANMAEDVELTVNDADNLADEADDADAVSKPAQNGL